MDCLVDGRPAPVLASIFRGGPGDPQGETYLGAAMMLGADRAVLAPPVAQEVYRTGIDGGQPRYWLIAGPPAAETADLFVAPVNRLRIAEEPDPHGYHHVAVILDVAGWRIPEEQRRPVADQPCTKAEAAELTDMVAGTAEPGLDWLAGARDALRRTTWVETAGARPFPFLILNGPPNPGPIPGPGPGGPPGTGDGAPPTIRPTRPLWCGHWIEPPC